MPAGCGPQKSLLCDPGWPHPLDGGGLVPIAMGSNRIIPAGGPKRQHGHSPEVQGEKKVPIKFNVHFIY